MKNKKTIAIAMSAMTVASMAVPAFASNVSAGGVNVRTANGREFNNTAVKEADLKEYLRANADKNPKVVGKAFINGDAHYAIELDMDMTHTENKVAKSQAVKDLQALKNELENLSKEQYNGKPRYTFEIKETQAFLTQKLTFNDGFTTVYVTDQKDSEQSVKSYVFQGVYTFNEDDVVDVDKEIIDFTPGGDFSTGGDHQTYKRLATAIYKIKNAVAQDKIYVTTEIDDKYIDYLHPTYKVNIYRKDKKVLVGQLLIVGYDTIDTNLLNKNYIIPQSNDFNGHWAEFDIIDAMQDKYVDLTSNFRPNESISRAEFAKIVCNVLKSDLNNITLENEFKFSDVDKEDWYYDYIAILAKKGIINGYEDGTFKPEATITRQEAAKIIASIKGIKEDTYLDINGKEIHKDTVTSFADDELIPTWVDKSVNELSKLGIIKGYKEGNEMYFNPANQIQRAEALVMIQRAK